MSYYKLTWLAPVLRDAGLVVVEESGWQTRGRGDVGTTRGVLCHHTAGAIGTSSLGTIIKGRSDLPGPLAHLYLARDGVYHCVAAGRANHAGTGKWQGVTNGNSELVGIEAENNGIGEPWGYNQMEAYARGAAAILRHIGAKPIMCAGHKEYALPKGRKPDPDFDMVKFRARVTELMGEVPTRTVVVAADDFLNVRSAPGGDVLGQLHDGDTVVQIAQQGNWVQIQWPKAGQTAWVYGKFLR